jgi:hypothetical protein
MEVKMSLWFATKYTLKTMDLGREKKYNVFAENRKQG